MMRAMMGKKKKVRVCEWITTVGIGSWQIPEGCTSVDCCLIAGGSPGGSADGEWKTSYSGAGGNGGALVNIYNLDVSSMRSISYAVGGPGENSKLGDKNAVTGAGPVGGASITYPGVARCALNGLAGKIGLFPFDNKILFKVCCGGGGGGAYVYATDSNPAYDNETVYSAYGGSPNGGNATGYYWFNGESDGLGGRGGGGIYYGDGGGGGGFSCSGPFGRRYRGSGSGGYQGCIILMYERKKLPTDIIDSVTGIVKVNWPSNA